MLWVNILLCYICLLWANTALHYSKFILTIHPKCKWIFSYYIKQSVPLSLPEITWSTPESLQMPTRNKEISIHSRTYIHIPVIYSNIRTPWYMIYDMYQPLCVSALRCHNQGVIITKTYKPTCQSLLFLPTGKTKILQC